jgi:hypothetical protein
MKLKEVPVSAEPEQKSAPYASKVSFDNFLTHLREHPPLPTRIDKGVMGHLNYGTKQALAATFKVLKLTTSDNVPTDLLERLVPASETERKPLYRQMLKDCYPFLFDGSIDLKRASSHEFQEKFKRETTVTGSTVDKAILFFLAIAGEAGIELSPHLAKRKSSTPGVAKRTKGRRTKTQSSVGAKANGSADKPDEDRVPSDMASRLLAKFPDLDPAWDENLKAKWFESFESLMKSAGLKG